MATDLDPAIVAALILRLIDGFYLATSIGLIDPQAMIPHLVQLLRRGFAPGAAENPSQTAQNPLRSRSTKP